MIKLRFWNFTQISNEEVELRIIGEIVDDTDQWFYQWFGVTSTTPNEFRKELDKYKGKNITVWIDSWGGDVFAAAGIYNALKNHDGRVVTKIDGKAVSAGSVVAMAGEEIQMSPVGIMMIHNPIGSVQWGEAKDMRKAADVMDEVKETIMNAFQIRTGKPREEISLLMDEETWMGAQKALSQGFIDGILFVEGTALEVQNSFMFSTMSIQNSIARQMQRFFEKYKELQNEAKAQNKEPEPPQDEETVSENKSLSLLSMAYKYSKNKY